MKRSSGTRRIAFALGLFAHLSAIAQGASWTQQPVRFILPVAAGGAADSFTRTIAEQLSRDIGVPVIVDNRPGGNSNIAASAVAEARPDGTTILLTTSGVIQNASFRKSIPNLLPKLAPVSKIASIPMGLAVSTELNATSVKELVAVAKSNPGKLSYASHGIGSISHIYGELLSRGAGIRMVHVPYRGEAQSIPDVLGGRLSGVFGATGSFKQHEAGGKIKLIAVTGPNRSKSVPNVPTFEELGFANLTLNGWLGVFVPAATPPVVVTQISEALKRVIDRSEIRQKYVQVGFEPSSTTPTEFAEQIKSELVAWPALVKGLDINFE